MTKVELRAHFASLLRAGILSPGERASASDAICAALRGQPAWSDAALVCAFLPLASEPAIASLWENEPAPEFCFPRIRNGEVELIRIADRQHLREANWKLAVAELETAPLIAPGAVDLFLVPGLAFTAHGARLGRGGGFYDRLLARRRPQSTALGVCFARQITHDLPLEPHDQTVDAVLTEHGLLPALPL